MKGTQSLGCTWDWWCPDGTSEFVWEIQMIYFRQSALTGHPTAKSFDSKFEKFDYLEAPFTI